MALTDNSLAPALGIGGKNVPQGVSASVLARKMLLVGTYLSTITDVVDNVPRRIFSANEAGALYGFGSMLHRMAIKAFEGSSGLDIYAAPQKESSVWTMAAYTINFLAPPGVSGIIPLYIGEDAVPTAVDKDDSNADIVSKLIDTVNSNKALPVTAAVGSSGNRLKLTAKTAGAWGNDIVVSVGAKGEPDPGAISYIITDDTTGAGLPDIQDVLDELGTGSEQNSEYFTDVVHGYGLDTNTLDKIDAYNGVANEEVGNFDDLVHRPFRSLNGNTTPGTAGLSALIAIGDARKETDRTSGVIPVPGSVNHPVEIACLALAKAATINNGRAEQSYKGLILDGVIPGAKADRWTSQYDNRDAAARAGVSCTIVNGSSVLMQNLLTFYHPDSVNPETNAYRNMRHISVLQNIFNAYAIEFGQAKWQQFSIVTDKSFVTNPSSRAIARSVTDVKDSFYLLFKAFAARAWIADLQFSVDKLKEAGAVVVRQGGNGFNCFPKFILSGDGDIIDINVEYDTSFAVLANQ